MSSLVCPPSPLLPQPPLWLLLSTFISQSSRNDFGECLLQKVSVPSSILIEAICFCISVGFDLLTGFVVNALRFLWEVSKGKDAAEYIFMLIMIEGFVCHYDPGSCVAGAIALGGVSHIPDRCCRGSWEAPQQQGARSWWDFFPRYGRLWTLFGCPVDTPLQYCIKVGDSTCRVPDQDGGSHFFKKGARGFAPIYGVLHSSVSQGKSILGCWKGGLTDCRTSNPGGTMLNSSLLWNSQPAVLL